MAPVKELQDLIHLDMDAISAYQKAIDAIEHESVAAKLREFQGDHRRHVADLSAEVTRLGGKPDVRTDVKGFFIGGFTAVMSQGTHSALVTMKGNEQLTTSTYKKALEHKELPETTKALLQRNYSDEARHLGWIENAIAKKVWEQKAAQHA
jgi:uncharacterized protein (TIGR02284 family)